MRKSLTETGLQAGWRHARLLQLGLAVAAVLGLSLFWRYSDTGARLDPGTLADGALALRGSTLAPLVVIAAYTLAGLVMFPVTVLIGVTAAVFTLAQAMAYAVLGSLVSAGVTYALGYALGRRTLHRMGGGRLYRLSERLSRRGLEAVIVSRILPVAPFSLINVVAGASHIRLRDFALGTMLGMIPGIVTVTLVVDRLRSAVVEPSLANLALAMAVSGLVAVAGLWGGRRLARRVLRLGHGRQGARQG